MLTFTLLLFLLTEPSQGTRNPVVDAVIKGMSCKQSSAATQLDCEYRVGQHLHFAIAGVGQPDVAATFYRVDWDGDFYASVGGVHGCVIVKPGKVTIDRWQRSGESTLHMAFVSLKNGKVYGDWRSCPGPQ